jgi:hypothetical protein
MKYQCEYTDTFGGESNYSWVRRATIELPETAGQAQVMRAAKAALGITGARGRTHNYGDMLEFRPYGCCTVAFITAEY